MGDDELRSLRRVLRDLVALTTLPAIWAGSEPYHIAESLSDVLITTLHLDLVYIYLTRMPEGGRLELVRTGQHLIVGDEAQEIGKIFAPLLKVDAANPVLSIADPLEDGPLQIAVIPIGPEAREGFAVAGVRSSNALTELDRLLLSVAANQAVTALQQAELLRNLRIANQLKDTLLANEQTARAEAQQIAERISLLQELTSWLSQSLTVEAIVDVILQTGTRLFGSDRGVVYAVSDKGQTLRVLGQLNTVGSQTQLGQLPLTISTPIRDAVQTQAMVWIENSDALVGMYPHLEHILRAGNTQALAAVPLLFKNQVMGCLELGFTSARKMTEEEANLLLAVAQQGVQAMERARLSEQIQEAATLRERQRIAHELHDAVSQTLFSANMIAEALPRSWERHPDKTLEQIQLLHQLTRGAAAEMRTLLTELRPESVVNAKLGSLLKQLAYAMQGRKEVDVAVITRGGNESPLPAATQMVFYRVAQESLNNIIKHGEATQVSIRLTRTPDRVMLVITDNGQGFDVNRIPTGMGLATMRERAESIGASLGIKSTMGRGTRVRLVWNW